MSAIIAARGGIGAVAIGPDKESDGLPTPEQDSWLQRALGVGSGTGAPAAAGNGAAPGAAKASGGGATLRFEFNAFIPGSLGKSFVSYNHPKDLKNQPAFEAALGGVGGTWLPEPGSFADNNTGPWLFETDNRSFGGGSHRVGFTGSVPGADIGGAKSKGAYFAHSTSGSARVRWKHSGLLTSSGETGSVEGPFKKSADVKSAEEHDDVSSTKSVITVTGAGSYPFNAMAPDIDYKLVFTLDRDPSGKILLNGEITTNVFPFYELMINGTLAWSFSSKGTGPGIVNLNTSQTSKMKPLTF